MTEKINNINAGPRACLINGKEFSCLIHPPFQGITVTVGENSPPYAKNKLEIIDLEGINIEDIDIGTDIVLPQPISAFSYVSYINVTKTISGTILVIYLDFLHAKWSKSYNLNHFVNDFKRFYEDKSLEYVGIELNSQPESVSLTLTYNIDKAEFIVPMINERIDTIKSFYEELLKLLYSKKDSKEFSFFKGLLKIKPWSTGPIEINSNKILEWIIILFKKAKTIISRNVA